MRVALLGPSYPFRGGIAHYTTLLYRALEAQHDVRFLAFRRQYPAWLYPGSSDRDSSARPLQADGAEPLLDALDPRTWVATADRLASHAPDLTILPWWTAYWALPYSVVLARLRQAGFGRTLFLCHNVVGHDAGALQRWVSRWVLRQGQAFMVHSQQEASVLRALIPGACLRCAPLPVIDLGQSDLSQQQAQQRLGVQGPVLLFFGFVRPYKGLGDLLAALPIVLSRRRVTLLVVGEFWQPRAEFERQARMLGIHDAVRFVDRYVPNEEVPAFFAAADLVVLPYQSATGSAIAQIALGCHKPVLATRVGSLADVIDDGQTGFLVSPGDPPALAQAILRFLDLPSDERLAFSRRIAEQEKRFSWERYLTCLSELAVEVGAL